MQFGDNSNNCRRAALDAAVHDRLSSTEELGITGVAGALLAPSSCFLCAAADNLIKIIIIPILKILFWSVSHRKHRQPTQLQAVRRGCPYSTVVLCGLENPEP